MNPSVRFFSHLLPILWLLGTLTTIADAFVPQGASGESGTPGTVAPQSVDVRLADSLVNQDTYGGTNQLLLSLAASPNAGFAAIWRDQRDGMLGIYLARTNAQGELLEPERPIHQPHSGRRLEPTVALGKDNSGAVTWVSSVAGTNVPWVRTFDSNGKWLCNDRPLVPLEEGPNKHYGRESGARLPVIAALPHGGYAVAWTQAGQVKYQEVEHDGAARGKTIRLAPSSPSAEPGVQLAISGRGAALCIWRTKEGNVAVNHSRSDTATINCGMGVLCRLITDPVGGFWAAFIVEGQAVLRHLSVEGKPDRPEIKPIPAAVTGLDLALGDDYLALLVETNSVPRGEARGGRGAGGDAGSGAARGAGKERGASSEPAARGDSSTRATGAPAGEPAPGDEHGTGGKGAGGTDAANSAGTTTSETGAVAGADAAHGTQAVGGEAGTGNERAVSASGDAQGKADSGAATGLSASDRDKPKSQPGSSTDKRSKGDGSASSFAVYLLDRDGREHASPLPIHLASDDAVSVNAPRIVSNGKRVFVAWTDERNVDQDIYGRTLEPSAPHGDTTRGTDPRMGVERRVNSDVASSDQNNPRIAGAGNVAVVAWQDGRDRVNRVFARTVGPSGFTSDEFSLPAPVGDAASTSAPGASPGAALGAGTQPAVAVRADGDFAVQWKATQGPTGVLCAQCFHAYKKPIGAPVTIEEGQGVPAHVITALGEARGYLIAWTRADRSGVWARRMMPDGKLGITVRVAEAKDGEPNDLAIALLDDQRLILAWDVHGPGESWSLRARFIDSDGAPKSEDLAFEPTSRKLDWQPCVAPAASNGFVMGWCSGGPSDGSHDVVARVFDLRGKPAGPVLPISYLPNEQDYAQILRLPDKTYVIAWEDDISFFDHTYLRKILPSGRELGPIVRMNELETKAVEDRTGPQIAVLGDGIVGAWSDRRRSLGWDVYMRILGPKFDDVKKR